MFRVAIAHEADGRVTLSNAFRNADEEQYSADDEQAATALANLVNWLGVALRS